MYSILLLLSYINLIYLFFLELVKSHPALSISLLILIFSEEFVYFLLIFAFGSGQVKITSESEMKEV